MYLRDIVITKIGSVKNIYDLLWCTLILVCSQILDLYATCVLKA